MQHMKHKLKKIHVQLSSRNKIFVQIKAYYMRRNNKTKTAIGFQKLKEKHPAN